MRITLTIHQFDAAQGGAEAFAVRVAKGLVARGHQLQVLAEGGSGDDQVPVLPIRLAEAPAKIAELAPNLSIDWGLDVPADLHRLGGGLHRAFLPYNSLSAPPGLRLAKALLQHLSPKHRRILAREAVLLARPQAHFLAVSEFIAQHLRQTARIADERLFTLVNGVPLQRFNFHCRLRYRREIRTILGLDDAHLVFLFVAHNSRLKNLQLLNELFEPFHQRVPTARLLVLGKHRPAPCPPWMIYAGHVATPERLYAAADAMLHPTFFDACANVVLEAMACGCPVVSSDCNGSAQVIKPEVNGLVLPVAGQPSRTIRAQWADALLRLAEDPGWRRRLGRNAAATIRAHHGMDDYLDRLEVVLATVANRKASRLRDCVTA